LIHRIKLAGTGWDEKLKDKLVLARWFDQLEGWVFYSSNTPFGTLQFIAYPDPDSSWYAELQVPDTTPEEPV